MKRLVLKSIAAVVAMAAFGMASAQDIKERTLKFGLNGPEGHPAVAGMKKFADLVLSQKRHCSRTQALVLPMRPRPSRCALRSV